MIIFGKTPEDYKRAIKKHAKKKWKYYLAFCLLLVLAITF